MDLWMDLCRFFDPPPLPPTHALMKCATQTKTHQVYGIRKEEGGEQEGGEVGGGEDTIHPVPLTTHLFLALWKCHMTLVR